MNWYEWNSGPLRALKKLLDSPLDFDPVNFIDKTFESIGSTVNPKTLQLAEFYNEVREHIFPKVRSAYSALSNSTKLDSCNFSEFILPFTHEFSNQAVFDKSISDALAIKTCDSVNLQIDRLLESFGVGNCSGHSLTVEVKELISFYLLSEALFLVLVGMAKVEFNNQTIIIKPSNNESVSQLHRKWFANYWEQSSALANIAYFDMLPKGSEKKRGFNQIISLLGQGLRDKIFSIPAVELPG